MQILFVDVWLSVGVTLSTLSRSCAYETCSQSVSHKYRLRP